MSVAQKTGEHNNVLLGKIGAGDWYTIYHQLPVVIGGRQTPLLINQLVGKGHQRSEHNLVTSQEIPWYTQCLMNQNPVT